MNYFKFYFIYFFFFTFFLFTSRKVREVVSTVDPNVRQGDSMNIREYVKIKIIPGGGMDENTYVDGIIFRKNVPHKSMSSRGNISNPRVLLFSGES